MKAYQRQTVTIMFENAKRSRAEAACQEIITGWPKEDNREGKWAASLQRRDRFVMWMLEQAKLTPTTGIHFHDAKDEQSSTSGSLFPTHSRNIRPRLEEKAVRQMVFRTVWT